MVTMSQIDALRKDANALLSLKRSAESDAEVQELDMQYRGLYEKIDRALAEYHSYADAAARRAMEDAA